MFGSFLNPFKAVDNALKVAIDIVTLEGPSRQSVAKLISDGLEIAAIAAAFGVAEDVIAELANQGTDND